MPAPLHGLAGPVLIAAPVLRSDHHLAVVLDVAAEFVHVVLVLGAQLHRHSLWLVDLDDIVLLKSQERIVDGGA